MTAETLSSISAVLLSLGFSYIPSANGWWENLNTNERKFVMLGLLFVVSLVIVIMACTGLAAEFGLTVTCDKSGIVAVAKAFGWAVIVNQSTFAASPKSQAKEAMSVVRKERETGLNVR